MGGGIPPAALVPRRLAVRYRVRIGEIDHEVEVTPQPGGRFQVTTGNRTFEVTLQRSGEAEYALQVEGETVNFLAQGPPSGLELLLGGELFSVEATPAGATSPGEPAPSGPLNVRAVMPGLVRAVYVLPDEQVERGGRLLSLEAMKMNNEIRAPRAGTVQAVRVSPGQRVDKGDVLVIIG